MNQFKQLADAGIKASEAGINFTLAVNSIRDKDIPKRFDKKFNIKNCYAD